MRCENIMEALYVAKDVYHRLFSFKVVTDLKPNGVLSDAEKKAQNDLYQQHKNSIRVPRRPYWDHRTGIISCVAQGSRGTPGNRRQAVNSMFLGIPAENDIPNQML